jgi:uncharacterized membrane protein YkoI
MARDECGTRINQLKGDFGMIKHMLTALVLPIALAGSIGLANAASGDQSVDVKLLNSAKISITEAIQAAEKASGGKVFGASFGGVKGKGVYELNVMTKGAVRTVEVDANTGKILQDTADNETDESGENGETDPN